MDEHEVLNENTVRFYLIRDNTSSDDDDIPIKWPHKLSVLTEFSMPLIIENYKYVCIQHFILRWMLCEYSKEDSLTPEEDNYTFSVIDSIKKLKTYSSFMSYYEKWLINPIHNDVSIAYEYYIVDQASQCERWQKSMFKYYSDIYWILFNHVKGLALSLEGKTILTDINQSYHMKYYLKIRLIKF